MEEQKPKQKSGAKKFLMGAALGAVAGAVAGHFVTRKVADCELEEIKEDLEDCFENANSSKLEDEIEHARKEDALEAAGEDVDEEDVDKEDINEEDATRE